MQALANLFLSLGSGVLGFGGLRWLRTTGLGLRAWGLGFKVSSGIPGLLAGNQGMEEKK